MVEAHPTLSLRERDRRWSLVKKLMKTKELDCLIVFGLNGREQYESYLSNDFVQGIVVFPLEGNPTYLAWITGRVIKHIQDMSQGVTPWIPDWRVGGSGQQTVAMLQEKRFHSATIGVVGLESWSAGEVEGYVPYKTWAYILEHLPSARFVDVSKEFSELVLVKSEEELELVRRSAAIGELACEALLDVVREGVTESEVYATVMDVIFRNGAGTKSPHLLLTTGVDNTAWAPPPWICQGGSPRGLKKGDILLAELFPCYGGFETQVQMAVAINPIHPINHECAEVARRSYEAGLKVLFSGITFQKVVDTMEAPLAEAGCWHLTPLIHTLSPLSWVGYMNVGISQLNQIYDYEGLSTIPIRGADLVLKPGMVFELEPNACRGKHRINIGGSVIVTEDGPEELNKLSNRLHAVG